MPRLFAIILCVALCLSASDTKRRKKDNLPDLEIMEANARRGERTIRLDGRARNAGDRPISGLVLQFDFMDSDHVLLTTQKAQIDEESLEPGQEASFHVELNDPVRAVEFQINATDQAGRELRVVRSGPFPIE